MEAVFYYTKKIVPKWLYVWIAPAYHFVLAFLGALFYGFPSKKITVIGVTGTKGKTTVVELVNAMLERAGFQTALANSIRFKIGSESHDNMLKMTMPGRFFLSQFLRNAVKAGASYAIIEMTSEGAKQFRHRFVALDALIFTNLAPEHIESHGSYENYRDAKLSIAKALERSPKKRRFIVVNIDDAEAEKFLSLNVSEKYHYSLKEAEPYEIRKEGLMLTWRGEEIASSLSGAFNVYNILAAAKTAECFGVPHKIIASVIAAFRGVPGRMERVEEGQPFTVLVDYAHTPDSLEKVYETFPFAQKICVLGAAGGGRDKWKRKIMGEIASKHCSRIFLTTEDPYDENPEEIMHNIAEGIRASVLEEVVDRRLAIRKALAIARAGDVVIMTGKGSEPFIMGPNGSKLPWNEAAVAREELKKLKIKNEKVKTTL